MSTVVASPPEDVYALVADVTRTPELSPDIVAIRWLDGATGPAVGARFEAVNQSRIGKRWKNRPVITDVDSRKTCSYEPKICLLTSTNSAKCGQDVGTATLKALHRLPGNSVSAGHTRWS